MRTASVTHATISPIVIGTVKRRFAEQREILRTSEETDKEPRHRLDTIRQVEMYSCHRLGSLPCYAHLQRQSCQQCNPENVREIPTDSQYSKYKHDFNCSNR
jgi:hypothetical protein